MWVLNSSALAHLGLDDDNHPAIERDATGRATGRLFGADHLVRTNEMPLDVAAVARRLARFGVTGVTDLTPTDDPGYINTIPNTRSPPGSPWTSR